MDQKLWMGEVKKHYDVILEHAERIVSADSTIVGGIVMLDIDETLMYHKVQDSTECFVIPHAVEFVGALREKFDIHIVTGRIDSGSRRAETVVDLKDFKYDKLHLRSVGEPHSTFKLRIQKEIRPVFSVGDQKTDYPDFLIPNPYYYIDMEGNEVYY